MVRVGREDTLGETRGDKDGGRWWTCWSGNLSLLFRRRGGPRSRVVFGVVFSLFVVVPNARVIVFGFVGVGQVLAACKLAKEEIIWYCQHSSQGAVSRFFCYPIRVSSDPCFF